MSQEQVEAVAVEVVQRRRISRQLKQQIVDETYTSGESVSAIARRHDVNTNQLFKWRQRYGHKPPAFVPVTLEGVRTLAPGSLPPAAALVEIEFASGHRVRLHGAADKDAVRQVIELLR